MKARIRTRVLAALVALAFHAGCNRPAAVGPQPPPERIVLVVIDTLRADHVSCYGHERPTTPRIDALATGGTKFLQAYAHASWTLPSFASLLTGLHPHEHRTGRNPSGSAMRFGKLDPSITTLPESLQRAGYRTAAFVNNPFLERSYGLHRGFDHYDFAPASNDSHRSAVDTVEAALTWLDRQGGAPAFLLVHMMEPHLLYDPPPHTRGRFRPTGVDPGFPEPFTRDFVDYRLGKKRLEPWQVDYVKRVYDEEILAADGAVGLLVDGLAGRDLEERTLLVVTSDHGEEFWDHGGFEHGHTLHGELTRVPLVLKGPGVGRASLRTPVQHADLFQGLLAAAGAERPDGSHGANLFDVIAAEDDRGLRPRSLLAEGQLYGHPMVALTRGRYRLILNLGDPHHTLWRIDENGVNDQLEAASRWTAPRRLELLVRLLALRGSFAEREATNEGVELDQDEAERLRALGYVE
jgi:arylsulfatase A-like enzyme